MRKQARIGFTLIELMVGMAIGLFLVAAAFTFVSHQTNLLEHTKMRIDMDRSGRMALDLLAQDLRHAGAGVGYEASGDFRGLLLGDFTVQGGAQFSGSNASITLAYGENTAGLTDYDTVTDDVGLRFANGDYRSIVDGSSSEAITCRTTSIRSGDIVLLTSENAFDAITRSVATISDQACDVCVNGCSAVTFGVDSTFSSNTNADDASYDNGELAGGFHQLVWFVAADEGRGTLRRASVNTANTCTARDNTCGQAVAYDVETLQTQYWQWDPTAGAWEDRTDDQSIVNANRIRVDIELVVRVRKSETAEKNVVTLQLEPGTCVPSCDNKDRVGRDVLRTSVEVRNSGRMTMSVLARAK